MNGAHARPVLSADITADPLPPHLVKVPGAKWAFWRWVCLRGAGFPAYYPQHLAAPHAVLGADHLLSLEQAAEQRIRAASAGIRLALDSVTDEAAKKPLYRALKQLNKGKIPEPTGTIADALTQEAASLLSQAEQAKAQFAIQFQSDVQKSSAKIREIAGDPHFRRAILLQNRAAFRRVLHSFSSPDHRPAKRGFKERQNEELIASYLQRYCLKNDTIGFFGPVGWAKLVSAENHLAVQAGTSLVSTSEVYFENWCIESLAEKMSAIKSLRPWLIPRLLPFFRVEERSLYSADGVSTLSALHAAVLQRCNGTSTAREIAQALIQIPEYGVRTEGQIYGVLQAYISRGVISGNFEIPFCLYPERKLRELLNNIEKDDLRQPLLEELDKLEQGREKIRRAIGDPEQLDQALEELDNTFTALTRRSATKSAGAMYASRTLVYQDCRRDLALEISQDLLVPLTLPLSLLLDSARWFSYQVAAVYRERCRHIYQELSQNGKDQKLTLLQLWTRLESLIFDRSERLFNRVLPEFQDRWETILQVPWERRRVEYSFAVLRPLVENAFAVPHAGWRLARYHSPDVMIAASSVDAIRRGDCAFVLGEVHMASNTISYSFAVSQHSQPEELFQAIQTDLPHPRVVFVPPRHWPRITNRTSVVLTSPQDHYLEVASIPVANGPRSRVVPISNFVVEQSDQDLVVCSRDHNLKFEIIEFLGEVLSGVAIEMLKIVRARDHVPRISIDKLVVVRESWSFRVRELDFIHSEAEHERYLQVWRWKQSHRLPRFVFARVPVEVKPFYLDFESPVYVEIFIKMIRRMLASDSQDGKVTLTEMLPTPDHVWLPDAMGNTYTSELRMIAWDLADQDP